MKNYIIREEYLEKNTIMKKWLGTQKTNWKASIKRLILEEFRRNGYTDILTGEVNMNGDDSKEP